MSFPNNIEVKTSLDEAVVQIMKAYWPPNEESVDPRILLRYFYGSALREVTKTKEEEAEWHSDCSPEVIQEFQDLYVSIPEDYSDCFEQMVGPRFVVDHVELSLATDMPIFAAKSASEVRRRREQATAQRAELIDKWADVVADTVEKILQLTLGDKLQTKGTLKRLAGYSDMVDLKPATDNFRPAQWSAVAFTLEWAAMQKHFAKDKFRRAIYTAASNGKKSIDDAQRSYIISTLPKNASYGSAAKFVNNIADAYERTKKDVLARIKADQAAVDAAYA